jgi:allophanate hydrolase subunit 1
MIYDEPIYRPLGDCYVAVEFGDEGDLALSFRVIALAEALRVARVPGIIELQPTLRLLGVQFDRELTTRAKVQATIEEILERPLLDQPIPSRVIDFPTWYDDPWSASTAERFEVQNNLEFVAEHNGMTKDEVIARHTGSLLWNAVVGFTPGTCLHYPLYGEPLTAPTYAKPRTFTLARCVGVIGTGTSPYSVTSPGGSQLIGRAAVDIYMATPNHDAFDAAGVLLRPGDRVQYRPVDPFEYEEIREQSARGTYDYRIEDGQFDALAYLQERDAERSVA